MVIVSQLQNERWEEYKQLRLHALQNDPIAFGSTFNDEKDCLQDAWITKMASMNFAILDDTPIDMISLVREKKTKFRHISNIYSVYVMPEFRRHGIGNMLMQAVMDQALTNPEIVKVKLTVNNSQFAAIRLYERFGFQMVGIMKKEACEGDTFSDELIMERILK